MRPLLAEVPPVGLSYVQDIERQEPQAYQALLAECEARCVLAEKIGCPMVQLLTGPLDPNGSYQGLAGKPWPEMRRLTAKNLDRAGQDRQSAPTSAFIWKRITFTPLNRLDQQLELLAETACDNVGLVLDFFHLWNSGTNPDEIARVDPSAHFLRRLLRFARCVRRTRRQFPERAQRLDGRRPHPA